jgi:glycosyltransferase involved in cell wall biosynthesis
MKVLVLSWEFPPRIIGGISRHVAELYPELVKLGHEIHLLTVEFGNAPRYELVDGIRVHRVAVAASHEFNQWVVNMNQSLLVHGEKLLPEDGPFHLIHAHDWLVADAAIALKQRFGLPLVATIHATESGRCNGIRTAEQAHIHAQEQRLVAESWRTIVCTNYMRLEVERALGATWEQIDVVYNGIRSEKKRLGTDFDIPAFRRWFAADCEKIVYYVGRLTYEKGITVLVEAAPQVIRALDSKVKFVVVGGGGHHSQELKERVTQLGLWDRFYFTGFLSELELNRLQALADCAVFPSLYEPFGIVALESFAARVPVVVSDTGGLPEVVQHGKTGIVTWRNNPDSLAWGILEVLRRPEYSQHLVENAYADLARRFHWPKLAQQTEAVYGRVLHEQGQGQIQVRRPVTPHMGLNY